MLIYWWLHVKMFLAAVNPEASLVVGPRFSKSWELCMAKAVGTLNPKSPGMGFGLCQQSYPRALWRPFDFSRLGFWVLGLGFRVWGFRVTRLLGLGLHVLGLGLSVCWMLRFEGLVV